MNVGFACALDQADQVDGCGQKASQLARLLRIGLAVPSGFVLTAKALETFLDHNRLTHRAQRVRSLLDESRDTNSDATELRQLVMSGSFPPPLVESLTAMQALMAGDGPWIVRSSALGEDGMAASFAGQLDSILDVECSRLDIAIGQCWASYWSERVLFYQQSRGIRLMGMAVIVQQQIQPVHAGVLFTAAPTGADRGGDEMLIEYCPGHAEALVQGRVDPGRVALSRSRWEIARLADPGGANPLEDGFFIELGRAGLAAEKLFGAPQDVEWARDEQRRLWLVQSRPVTTRTAAEKQDDAGESVEWSNANVNENYPEPISPFLYSVALRSYYHYFRGLGEAFGIASKRIAAMEQPLRQIIGAHGARMYYNLTNIYAVLRAAPFGERLQEYFSAFTGAEPASSRRPKALARGSWFEAITIGANAIRLFRSLDSRVTAFERTVDAYAFRTRPEALKEASRTDLLQFLRGFLDIRFHRWTSAGLADAAAMISYGLLKHVLRQEFADSEQSSLHNTLLKGLTDLVSSEPTVELWRLSRMVRADPALSAAFARLDNHALLADDGKTELAGFRAALRHYLSRWGFRRSGELMLTVPDYQERPGPVVDLIRAYAALDADSPQDRLRRLQVERQEETKRILSVLAARRFSWWLRWPTKASVAGFLLRWCQQAIGLRERSRMRQALLYTRCRSVALAIGQRLTTSGDFDAPEDVFFLTYQELEDFLSGAAMLPHHHRDLVRLRRQAHAHESAKKPADRLTLAAGRYLAPDRRTEVDPAFAKQAMAGVGACGGSATGPAAVLADVAACCQLAPGDILVTRQTDPGWGPAFLLIRGLVLERGGMLSHGAILAREYGIPTVVGVAGAVANIQTGQSLHVDGDRGVVRILPS